MFQDLNFVAVNFVRVMLLNAKINGLVRESSDEEDDGSSDSDSDSDID